jgi:hypothetical protein
MAALSEDKMHEPGVPRCNRAHIPIAKVGVPLAVARALLVAVALVVRNDQSGDRRVDRALLVSR